MATTLGQLIIELRAKTDAFERGMKSAKDLTFSTSGEIVGSLERIGKSIAGLRFNNFDQAGRSLAIFGGIAAAAGVALATSLVAVAEETSKKMVEMGHDAEKAGMDIKDFTEFAYAAKRSQVPIEDFTNAMSKLANTALTAAQGNTQAQRALSLAGTSATDSAGRLRSTGDILGDIIKKYEIMTDRTLKAGLARQVFGRGGASIIPFLNQGSAAIQKYREEAERLGVAFDESSLNAARQFQGTLVQFKASAEGAAVQLTAGLLPALNDLVASLTKVEGHSSTMRNFGESIGEGLKRAAVGVDTLITGFKLLALRLEDIGELGNVFASGGVYGAGAAFAQYLENRKDRSKEYDQILESFYNRSGAILFGGQQTPLTPEKPRVGTTGLNSTKDNIAVEIIQKLKERIEATNRLADAELISERAVSAATASNQADALILQIATKAAKEHGTALKDELAAAQKKYGATILGLTTIEEEAKRTEALNKSIVEQTRDAEASSAAHKRMADAIILGGDAIDQANAATQIDHLLRKANIELNNDELASIVKLGDFTQLENKLREAGTKLTRDQIAAIEALVNARRGESDNSDAEAFSKEAVSLQAAARATQLLITAQNQGIDAQIEARAQIEAENFALQHNIDLHDERIKKLQQDIAANLRASAAQTTSAQIQQEYNPQATYRNRVTEITNAAAQPNSGITPQQATAAIQDAYLREQEELDQLLLKSKTVSGGMMVFFRDTVRASRDMARQTYEAMSQVWDAMNRGFSSALGDIIVGTKTAGQAFRDMGVSMLRSMIDALSGIVIRWLETKAILAAAKLFGIDLGDDPMKTATKQIAANTAQAQSYAGLAAATEFAYALSSSLGDLPYAVAMSAVALGIGEGYAALSAFDNGGIMGKTGIALVHQNEGVLTAPTTRMLTNVNKMVNSMSMANLQPVSDSGRFSSSMPMTFNFHNATDPETTANRVADVVITRVRREFRTGGVRR